MASKTKIVIKDMGSTLRGHVDSREEIHGPIIPWVRRHARAKTTWLKGVCVFKGAVARSLLSLSACLVFFLVTSAEAAKVTLEKQEIYSQEGELLGFRDFTAQALDSLGVRVIADYPTYVAGEVSDDDVVAFQHVATDQGILFTLHPEWDTVSLNGYSFPSSGPPLGLPQDLQVPGFDGDIGLYLVQLKAPPAAGWQEMLTRAGEVVGYYPWNTYLMRLPPAALAGVRSLSVVQHVSPYQPAYKISADWPAMARVWVRSSRAIPTRRLSLTRGATTAVPASRPPPSSSLRRLAHPTRPLTSVL